MRVLMCVCVCVCGGSGETEGESEQVTGEGEGQDEGRGREREILRLRVKGEGCGCGCGRDEPPDEIVDSVRVEQLLHRGQQAEQQLRRAGAEVFEGTAGRIWIDRAAASGGLGLSGRVRRRLKVVVIELSRRKTDLGASDGMFCNGQATGQASSELGTAQRRASPHTDTQLPDLVCQVLHGYPPDAPTPPTPYPLPCHFHGRCHCPGKHGCGGTWAW